MVVSTKTRRTYVRSFIGLLIALLSVSCSSFNRTFTNRTYKKNGYEITSPEGNFIFENDPFKRKLIVDVGYDQKTFIETNGDNKVDQVKFKYEEYERTEDGTKEIFKKADRRWKHMLKFLEVPEVHKKWKNMSPSERLEERSY